MEWRDKMRQLREDFFSDDHQMRRSELGDEFSAVKSRLMEDLMSSRPGYYASHGQHLSNDYQKGDRGPDKRQGAADLLGRQGGEGNVKERLSSGRGDARQQWSDLGGAGACKDGRDKIDLSRGSAGSDPGPAQPLSSHSLANLYDKIKALKGEFQSVEQRMRSAVEALPAEKRSNYNAGAQGCDGQHDGMSVHSSRGTDSDYGSEFNSRVASPVFASPTPTPTPTPHVFVSNCPPSRGVTNMAHQNLPPSCSPTSSFSSFSHYSHPPRSPSPSLSDYNSESTLRPSSPDSRGASRLNHSETYVQIPVVVKGGCDRIEVGRQPLPSWEISWEWGWGQPGVRRQETWGYSATVYTYMDV